MEEYTNQTALYRPSDTEKQAFLTRTYGWMALALLITAVTAFFTAMSGPLMGAIWGAGTGRPVLFYVLAIAQIAIVWVLALAIRRISVGAALVAFLAYSVLNGLTMSSIFWVFKLNSIAYAFLGTAAMFAMMSVYGARTKQSLAKAGHYLIMALIGLVIVSLINSLVTFILKMPLSWVDWLISFATVIIFTGLTAYDTQKIMRSAEHATDSDDYKKIAIIGALELYLDFINIFLSLLRLFGRRK